MNKDSNYKRGKKPYPPKGKRPQSRERLDDSKKMVKEGVVESKDSDLLSKHNNVEWYGGGSVLTDSACKIPYTYPLGTTMIGQYYGGSDNLISLGYDKDMNVVSGALPTAAPGFMTFLATITPGMSETPSSPINVAMRKIYAFIRKNNSGAANYEPVDMFMYILSMDEIYTMWSHIMRAFGYLYYYSSMNRYYAQGAYRAMCVNYDDLAANAATYRTRFNVISAKVNSFAVPNVMSIFKRHGWLFQNIYIDTPEDKAQSYIVIPAGYRTFEPYESESGGYMKWNALSGSGLTVRKMSDWLDILEDMIDKMTVNEDMNIMSGDIEKAYGSESLVKLGMITETLMFAPSYDEGFLNQLENAVITGMPTSNDVTQSIGNLVYNPIFAPTTITTKTAFDYWTEARMLNSHNPNPTSDDTLQATRWTVMGGELTEGVGWTPTSFGSDILCGAFFTYAALDPTDSVVKYLSSYIISSLETDDYATIPTLPMRWVNWLRFLLPFSRAPEFVCSVTFGIGDPGEWPTAFFTKQACRTMVLDNFAFLSSELNATIHQAALIYLFGVQGL
jgi:hypothetical protein